MDSYRWIVIDGEAPRSTCYEGGRGDAPAMPAAADALSPLPLPPSDKPCRNGKSGCPRRTLHRQMAQQLGVDPLAAATHALDLIDNARGQPWLRLVYLFCLRPGCRSSPAVRRDGLYLKERSDGVEGRRLDQAEGHQERAHPAVRGEPKVRRFRRGACCDRRQRQLGSAAEAKLL